MTDNLLALAHRHALWQRGDTVCVALSGGCDSVALLHALLSVREREGITVTAAHVHHHLRGEAADADAAFCEDLCRAWHVPLTRFDVDVRAEQRQGESEELCARRLRYGALDTLLAQGTLVATAHTQSDQAETVLFRLARGSGLKGLGGIPVRRGGYLRPLLTSSRADTETYCRENGLAFCTDATNAQDDFDRNFLRHRVLPELAERFPAYEQAFSRAAFHLAEVDAMLDEMADDLLRAAAGDRGLVAKTLLASPRPVVTRALQIYVERETGRVPDAAHTESLYDLLTAKGKQPLAGDVQAVCDDTLRLLFPQPTATPFCVPLTVGDIDTPYLTLRVCESKTLPSVHKLLMTAVVDCDKIKGKAVVRSRRDGDSLRLKSRCEKPLRKWMNEVRLPAEKRDLWAVLADDDGVIAVPGIGVDARVAPDETSRRVWIMEAEEKEC